MRKAFVEIKTAKKRAGGGHDVAGGKDRKEGRKRRKEVHASYHGST